MTVTAIKFYQTGTHTVGNRLLDPSERSVQSDARRTNSLEDAEIAVVALGSVLGTIKDTVDDLREAGHRIGVLGITSYRPFPLAAIREALQNAQRVIVVEKCFAVGLGGIVSRDVRMALRNLPQPVFDVVAGLGGRAITKASLHKLLMDGIADKLEAVTFLDLDWKAVNKELERERTKRRSGPIAENLLRDLGVVAARIG